MNKTIFNIKVINWALILTALVYILLGAYYPRMMFNHGGIYIVLGIFWTFLFLKINFLSKEERVESFFKKKKQLPLLLYMLMIGLLLHRYLETVYWAPKRQKAFEEIQRKYEERSGRSEQNR
ncbi:hypothetical protein [Dyadobacter luticola]|uniref:Uncharacterized protein n=1 Tax=Dyadobacter luticola TaxID=1979387 RepID=A0A5R9KP16_9BACT|nr:hypothetical protein [Dyadobacter luticola]TLU98025.1 hypothetical protein FEN17_24875 [Dyadobacter luticola]